MKRSVKILVGILLGYIVLVATFESLLGYFQPANQSTLVIRTTNNAGVANDRVLARIENDGQLYVAANHWPRAWYRQALENQRVQITLENGTGNYLAVPVNDQEHDRVNGANSLGLVFKFLTGFPPRYFVRLDPEGNEF